MNVPPIGRFPPSILEGRGCGHGHACSCGDGYSRPQREDGTVEKTSSVASHGMRARVTVTVTVTVTVILKMWKITGGDVL